MKKLLLTLTSAALATIASAQVSVQSPNAISTVTSTAPVEYNQAKKVAKIESNQRWVGYYRSDALAEYGMGAYFVPGDNKAAICLDADMLKPYAGMKIVGIRFGLCSNIGKSRVFITEVKDQQTGEDLTEEPVENAVIGWNEVTLTTPYVISGDDNVALLVGYDYTQLADPNDEASYPFSCVEEGEPKSLYVYCDYEAGGGIGWYRLGTNNRNMSIQALVQGDFAAYDVTPEDFGTIVGAANKDVSFSVSFFNNSAEAVSELNYVVTVDGVAGDEQRAAFSPSVGVGSNGTFKVTVPCGSEDGKKAVKVEITKVNGHDNEAADKVAEGSIGVSSTLFDRNVVIEEFTTENCPNCPRVANYLHEYFETADQSRVFAVCHHSAYYTDWLTKQCDEDLTELFNDAGYTYAPAVMFNREPDFESAYASGEKDNVTIPGSADEISKIVEYYMTQTLANAKLSMQLVPSADNSEVTAVISGVCNDVYGVESSLLTVYLTEDNVNAKSQAGASGKFIHQHVIRDYNSSWGDKVNWESGKFTATYSFEIDNSWKTEDLKVVAFLNKHNKSNVFDNRIENSIGLSLEDAKNAINGVETNDNAVEVARYNAAGQQIYGQQKGLNIVKLSDGRTLKVVVK